MIERCGRCAFSIGAGSLSAWQFRVQVERQARTCAAQEILIVLDVSVPRDSVTVTCCGLDGEIGRENCY
jgi:hypothetical protein